MPEPALADRIAALRGAIADRQKVGGWSHPVRIVAVTKTHGPETVRAAVAAGLDAVGENRVQEALTKMAATADLPVEWHLIGTLQRNKARLAVGRFALIHSVDRADLAAELDHRAAPGSVQPVLVQVNCSAEPQKGGVEPGDLAALLDAMRVMPRLRVDGLMTMAAFTDDEGAQRRSFAQLRTLRETMQREGHPLPELSMGMSDDFPAAVEEGATMLRIGSLLFGPRPSPVTDTTL